MPTKWLRWNRVKCKYDEITIKSNRNKRWKCICGFKNRIHWDKCRECGQSQYFPIRTKE